MMFTRLLVAGKTSSSVNQYKIFYKLLAIVEVTIITFLATLIPELMKIGRVPTFDEIYVPILSSLLMAIYSYIRMRNLEVTE